MLFSRYYSGTNVSGATSYNWQLPTPFDLNPPASPSPPRWGIRTGGATRYLTAYVGPKNGQVRFKGINKCGGGIARTINVTLATNTGGGISAGGGNMPFNFLTETIGSEEISYYPNPANDQLFIDLGSDTAVTIDIIDIQGRIVLHKPIDQAKTSLNVSHITAGVYFIRVSGTRQDIQKLIINH